MTLDAYPNVYASFNDKVILIYLICSHHQSWNYHSTMKGEKLKCFNSYDAFMDISSGLHFFDKATLPTPLKILVDHFCRRKHFFRVIPLSFSDIYHELPLMLPF